MQTPCIILFFNVIGVYICALRKLTPSSIFVYSPNFQFVEITLRPAGLVSVARHCVMKVATLPVQTGREAVHPQYHGSLLPTRFRQAGRQRIPNTMVEYSLLRNGYDHQGSGNKSLNRTKQQWHGIA